MALGGIYKTGTISTDGTAVTGTGTLWSVAQIEQGDFLIAAGLVGIVSSVTDDTHIILESAWAGTDLSDASYELLKMSWVRYDPSYVQAKVRDLLAELQGTGVIYAVTTDAPDVGIGEDGQYALKTNAGAWKLWLKVSGEWQLQGTPVGIISKGDWSSNTTYAVNDWVTRNGSAYISQTANNLNHDPVTDSTNWTLFGAQGLQGDKGDKGDTGATPVISGTSTSSVTVGTGTKTFTTQSGIAWVDGQRIRAVSSDLSKVIEGPIFSYSGTTLTISPDYTEGSGSASSWTFSIVGETGTAATVAVDSVVTGDEGTDASVTNVGNSTAAKLKFAIPRGDKGDNFQPQNIVSAIDGRDTYDAGPVFDSNGIRLSVLVTSDSNNDNKPTLYFLETAAADGNPAVWSNGITFGEANAAASGISFDDTSAELGASTVQTAIEAMQTEIGTLPDPVAMAIVFGS